MMHSRLAVLISLLCFLAPLGHRDLHSFPTRRSSDLPTLPVSTRGSIATSWLAALALGILACASPATNGGQNSPSTAPSRPNTRDRKSTRLNSSHLGISYAVFCLKKKKQTKQTNK